MDSTANEFARLIIAAKEKNLTRLSAKLEDPSTQPLKPTGIFKYILKL